MNSSYILLMLFVFVFGLCFGSFLNVFILRGLSGENFILDHSKCPKCNNLLKWYMNIPVFSYIFLKGRCAFCKEKISIQYPIVELICATSFVIAFLVFGLELKSFFVCAFFFFFIAIFTTDILKKVIIDYHTYILAILGLIYSYLKLGNADLKFSIIGAIVGFLLIEIIARVGKLFAGERAFGEGDSLICLGLGTIFGLDIFLIIAISIAIQGFMALPVLSYYSFKEKKTNLCISYILVGLSFIYLILANIYNLDNYTFLYMISVIVLAICLMWALKNIINSIKEKKLNADDESYVENYSFMPFGPALIISAIIGIFYIQNIKTFLAGFFG